MPARTTGTVNQPGLEAEVADRRDDTDDLSRRIRGISTQSAIQSRQPAAIDQARQSLAVAPKARAKPKPASPNRKPAYPAPLGRRPMIEWIPPAELTIDDAYQRTTENPASQALIKRIADGR